METAPRTENGGNGSCGLNNYRAPVNFKWYGHEQDMELVTEDIDDLPGDLRFNATQPGPLIICHCGHLALFQENMVCHILNYMVRMQEDQRLKQALWARAEIMGQDPIVPGPSRYGYRMMGDY